MKQREKIVPLAKGEVVEIGVGSGLNLPFYDPGRVDHLLAIDPSRDIWNLNKVEPSELGFEFDFEEAYAENLPLDNNSIDTVVTTYTVCSIPDRHKAFEEMRRVLRPTGHVLFCEHGKAPDKMVYLMQNICNPIWKAMGGGCTINLNIPQIIEENGFRIDQIDTMYIPGWKPACFNYWGTAKAR